MAHFFRRALLPAPEILLFLLVFYMSLFFMPDMINSDGDLPRHITVGNYILDMGTIPVQEVFSHTRAGEPMFLHEWSIEVVDALVFRAAGLNGIAWVTALLLAAVYVTLAVLLRVLGVSAPIAFLAALAAYLASAIHQLPRPHLFAWLFFVLLLFACEMYRKTDRAYWLGLVLPIILVWANAHGTFITAFVVLGIYAVGAFLGRMPRRALFFVATLGVSFALSFITPFGGGMLAHFSDFLGNRFLVDTIVEYASPNFHNISAWLFAAWILFSIFLFGRAGTVVDWTGMLLLCAWTAFGLYSARNIPNYAIVAAIVTAPMAEEWLTTVLPAARKRLMNLDKTAPIAGGWAWGLVVVVVLIGLQANGTKLDVRGTGNTFTEASFPIRAVEAVKAQAIRGNMFNEYTWGGYLLYCLYPEQRVFIDGAIDVYGESLAHEYLDTMNAKDGWQDTLQKYNVQWVIIPSQRPLAQALKQSAAWREAYRDEGAVIWVRQ